MTSEEIRERMEAIEEGKVVNPEWLLCDVCEALLRRIERLEENHRATASDLSQHLNE